MSFIFCSKRVILSLFISIIFFSCDKSEGIGGTSTIKGKIQALEGSYNPFTNQFDTTALYFASDENVYIIYGNDSSQVYDDDFETSWDGTYEFNFLRTGNYTLFAYSKCDTCLSGTKPLFWRVEILNNNEEYIQNVKTIRK